MTNQFDGYIFQQQQQTEVFRQESAEREMAFWAQKLRPFNLIRPKLYPDGNKWCALYGDNLQDGVCAFGDTPELAAQAFDLAWKDELLPTPYKGDDHD